MGKDEELKTLLKEYLSKFTSLELGLFFKDIIEKDFDVIFSRKLLDYLSKNNEELKEMIKEKDKASFAFEIDKIKRELLRHRFSLLNLNYSYRDDSGEIDSDDPLRCLFNKSYSLVKELLKVHLLEDAALIVKMMKNIEVHYVYDSIVDDECVDISNIIYEYDDDNYIEIDDEDELEEEIDNEKLFYIDDFHDIDEYFYRLDLDFTLSDLDYVVLLSNIKSSSFIEGITNYIEDMDEEGEESYSLDFAKLFLEYDYDMETYINLLNDVFVNLINNNVTDFKSFFIGINKIDGDIIPIIETAKKYPCCYKYVYHLFYKKSPELITTYLPFFLSHMVELTRFDIQPIDLLIEASEKVHRDDLIVKYSEISYRIEPNLKSLIYLKALAPKEIIEKVNCLSVSNSEIKKYEASIILGLINKNVLASFENEKALGWTYSDRSTILTILENIIYQEDDVFNHYLYKKLIYSINDFKNHISEDYIKLYIDMIKTIGVDKNMIMSSIEKIMVNRIESIVFNNCRGSYRKAAILLKELEIFDSQYHAVKTNLKMLLDSLRGHPAFIREYNSVDLMRIYIDER